MAHRSGFDSLFVWTLFFARPTILVRGRTFGFGIVNRDSSAILTDVNVTVLGAMDHNIGILAGFDSNESLGLTMLRSSVYASGGVEDTGIMDFGASSFGPWVTVRGSEIRGDEYGILVIDPHTSPTLAGIVLAASRVAGQISTVDAVLSWLAVANSTLDGGPVVAATATCNSVVDGNGDPYGAGCESP